MHINNFFLILLLFENILHCTSQTVRQEVTGINKSEQTKGFETNNNGFQNITNNEAVGKNENNRVYTTINDRHVESSNATILSTLSPLSRLPSITSSQKTEETELPIGTLPGKIPRLAVSSPETNLELSEETVPSEENIYVTTTETTSRNSHDDEEETGKYQEENATGYVDQESTTLKEMTIPDDEVSTTTYEEETTSYEEHTDSTYSKTTFYRDMKYHYTNTENGDIAADEYVTRDDYDIDETSPTLIPTSTTKHIKEEDFENGQINAEDLNAENLNPEKIVFFPLWRQSETAEDILIKTIDFVREELITHIFSDREMSEAIRALHKPKIWNMIQTLKQHPKYETLDQLLIENELGSLNYFDLSNLEELLPKKSRIRPSFKRVYDHIEQYFLRKETSNRLKKAFTESTYYNVLHKPTLKHKIQTLLRDILRLKITQRIFSALEKYNIKVKNAIALILNIIGYT